ncbi:MAG TPA: hypothetical protein VJZ76_19145 [Thermoanaerobaculia bacterium]|nr:hypothetical protein [Thermoanaerobaculia bacterium]
MKRLLPLCVYLIAAAAAARVVSYAPYTDRITIGAVQSRMNRHFVLFELAPGSSNSAKGQVVVYDTLGLEEPRVVLDNLAVYALAAREDDQQFAIFVQTSATSALVTVDGAASWKTVGLPSVNNLGNFTKQIPDTGGPFARGRWSPLRIGTRQYPFYFATASNLYALSENGSIKGLYTPAVASQSVRMIGTSLDGAAVLYAVDRNVFSIDTNGVSRSYGALPTIPSFAEGWITSDAAAYVELTSVYDTALYYVKDGVAGFVNGSGSDSFYAVPAGDYNGAWMIFRSTSRTTLYSHKPGTGLLKHWDDVTAPQVEALHPARSNTKVLIQVHRPRQAIDQVQLKDPALAVWHAGDPAPKSYDELYLNENSAKGFVHLDVDKVESGDPFVFDSGAQAIFFPPTGGGGISAGGGGGSEVVQEWGVMRASLAQRLVLPGAARTAGAFGSFWSTDVTFYNPSDQSQTVQVHYAANGNTLAIAADNSRSVTLGPREIRTIPDILKNLFLFDSGIGALYIVPPAGQSVNVTARTYSSSDKGTFGFGMNAIDVFAAASPRFPVTFSGAFLGANFRTNLVITDVSGRGAEAGLLAWGGFGLAGESFMTYSVPVLGQQQFQSIGAPLSVGPADSGALVVTPTRGEAVASVFAIDNRTNDSTYFPPDLPASVVRVIPAIGHLDGANGSKFRTDLYLFNNSDSIKYVTLQAKVWDSAAASSVTLTLLPHEARTITDVLKAAFNLSGIARLRYFQQGSATTDTSVRVTSRTYTVGPDGGTYGFLMPPLNSFQSGGPGDTLEILGTSLDKRFRTNLGLVDLMPFSGRTSRATVAIIDDRGKQLDAFNVTLPSLGGNQINDLFHARGLPESATPVLLRVTVIEGSVGAYAAVVDNGTNDPAYFAANLAAKP